MYLLYLDEFGHDGRYDPVDPRHSHHPLFGLAGFVIDAARARDFDRGFLRLKKQFFAFEIQRAQTLQGLRPERFEWKDLRNRRDLRFALAVLGLVDSHDGRVFIQGVRKRPGPAYDSDAVYNSRVQQLLSSFERFLRSRSGTKFGQGIVVMDQRGPAKDEKLLASAQSHLFSSDEHRGGYKRIPESPLLVPSHWYHGVQAADVVGRAAGHVWRWRLCQEAKYQKYNAKLGPHLDRLAFVSRRGQSSVWVR